MAMLPMFGFAQNKYFNADGINKLKSTVSLAKLQASNSSIQTVAEIQLSLIHI